MNIFGSLAEHGQVIDTKTNQEKELKDFPFRYLGLYFTATWCYHCVKIVDKLPIWLSKVNSTGEHLRLLTFRLDDDHTNFAYNYLRFKYMDNDKASQIAANLGVRHIPSIVVYDFMGRLVSLNGLQDIMNNLENTIPFWDKKMGNQ